MSDQSNRSRSAMPGDSGELLARRRLLALGLGTTAALAGSRVLDADEAAAAPQLMDPAGPETITGDWTFNPTGGAGSATSKDLALVRRAPLNPRYPQFGAVANGSTNDRNAIQAAIDACAANGGGTVVLDGTFAWSGTLTVKPGVWLEGFASNEGSSGSRLKALDNTARLQVGSWFGLDRPGGLRRLRVDGNGTGDSGGLVWLECVQATFESVTITKAAGKGLYLNAAQNNTFTAVDVFACGVGVSLDNGAGGNLWVRCEHRANDLGLELIESSPGGPGNGYPFGPGDNKWIGGIFETTQDGSQHTALADIRCGSHNHFYAVGFSNNEDTLSQGSQVVVSNPTFTNIPTSVHFDSCIFNGAAGQKADAIRIVGQNVVRITGDTFVQNSTDLFVQEAPTDVPSGILELDGSLYVNPGTVTNRYRTRGDGSLLRWIVRDQGYVNEANLLTGPGAVTLDAASFTVHRIALGQNLTGMTVDGGVPGSPPGAVPGSRLRVIILQGAAGGKSYVWASNMRFSGAAPNDQTANTATIVDFVYDGHAAKWLETNRSVAVPWV